MVSADAYHAARHAAAAIDRSDRGLIVVSGKDRASYLHGLLTNDIAALQAGEGCYAAYLTPQGRMITDMWVYELGDVILLTLGLDMKDAILSKLDDLVFTEEVQIGDLTGTMTGIAVVGPDSARVTTDLFSGISIDRVATLPEHGNIRADFVGHAAIILRITDAGESGYEILVDATQAEVLRTALTTHGIPSIDRATAEILRVESGVPKFHQDMDDETIPLEAGIESRAISFTKGCYVGQEVIVRVMHRGHGRVARRLVGLTLEDGAAPNAKTRVFSGGREIGWITSSAVSIALNRPIALAYLQRDFADVGTAIDVAGTPAVVTALPFVPQQDRR